MNMKQTKTSGYALCTLRRHGQDDMDGIYGPEAVVTAVRLAVLQSMCTYRECSPGTVLVADPESDESVHIPESESQVIDPRIPDWRGL